MNWRPAQPAQLEVGARSETGHVRDENQDRMSGTHVPLGHLYIVADGMGGHKGGAVAAELVVQELQRAIGAAPVEASAEQVIQAAFNKTNEIVYQRAHAGDPTTEGMGSTAVLALISGPVARVAHVGDSRAYLYHKGRLTQLTTDHTVVQKMVQAGMLKPSEAADHPNASILDRALGSQPSVMVDISKPWRLTAGDTMLLCSDGLSGYVTDAEIASVLRSQASVQEVPERLIKLALQKGGEDNVTVQVIQYGRRQETHRGARRSLPPFFQLVAGLVLGATLSAAALSLYLPERESGSTTQQSTLITDFQQTQRELEHTRKQLGAVQIERDTQREKTEGLEKQNGEMLKEAQEAKNKFLEEENKLANDRYSYKKQLASSQNQLEKTREELATVKKKLEKAEQDLKTARQELKSTKANLQPDNDARGRLKSGGAPEPTVTSEPTATSGPNITPNAGEPGRQETADQ
jgi:PPM family protein phosphatase